MTSRGKDQLDDEFEAFLVGHGELARQLSALQQPESPERLNAAIIANAEAAMAREKRETVAVQRRPAANSARWRVPVAMAASVIGAVLLMVQWQPDGYAPPAPAEMREQPKVAAMPDAAPQPAPADSPAPEQPALRPRSAPTMAKAADKAQPSRSEAPADAAPAPVIAEERPQVLAYAPPPPPPPMPVRDRVALAARAAPPPPMIALPAPAPAPPPAAAIAPFSTTIASPSARQEAALANTAKAAAWLNVIDEMLKADLRNDALEEWKKFRLAYPDYPVPDALAKRIAAIE